MRKTFILWSLLGADALLMGVLFADRYKAPAAANGPRSDYLISEPNRQEGVPSVVASADLKSPFIPYVP